MECYIVRFWFTNESGFREQREESVQAKGKNGHEQAKKIAKKKFNLTEDDVIRVTYA